MGDFNQAVELVLSNEGGFVDNASDSGGATNFGISLRFLREIPSDRLKKYGIFDEPTITTIKDLTRSQAIAIYKWEFWEHANFEAILDQRVCDYIFDMCVLSGISQGIKLAQRALWGTTRIIDYIFDDGILGNITMHAINLVCSDKYMHEAFIAAIVTERAGYFRLIAEIRPKDRENLNGWLKRCYRF